MFNPHFITAVSCLCLYVTIPLLQDLCLYLSPIAARRHERRVATERTHRCNRVVRAAHKQGATAYPLPVQVRPVPQPSCYSHASRSPLLASQRRVCTHSSVRCYSLLNIVVIIFVLCLYVARSSTGSVDLCLLRPS